MDGKELKKVIESTGLPKGKLAAAMGVSHQALNQFYRTTDLRQETLDKLDEAIRILTDGKKCLADFMLSPTSVTTDTQTDPETLGTNRTDMRSGTVYCDPIPAVTSEEMRNVDAKIHQASADFVGRRMSSCASELPRHEQNIIEVYAHSIADLERMHIELSREISEVRALKSDLKQLIASLASSQMNVAADSINPDESD